MFIFTGCFKGVEKDINVEDKKKHPQRRIHQGNSSLLDWGGGATVFNELVKASYGYRGSGVTLQKSIDILNIAVTQMSPFRLTIVNLTKWNSREKLSCGYIFVNLLLSNFCHVSWKNVQLVKKELTVQQEVSVLIEFSLSKTASVNSFFYSFFHFSFCIHKAKNNGTKLFNKVVEKQDKKIYKKSSENPSFQWRLPGFFHVCSKIVPS